jgi:uncharacterized protein (DUF488 family)
VARRRRTSTVFTIGHSTRGIDELIELLHAHGVRLLADIRTIPRSRRNPQFEQSRLSASLQGAGLDYIHLPALGGLRKPHKDSPNSGWQNASFRGYADYMSTAEFASGITQLLDLARATDPVAIMCAEAVPWRCHRSMVADALVVRGEHVEHIVGPGPSQPHHLNPMARVDNSRITYPGGTTASPESKPEKR